jgi:hypothetical protein
LAKLSESTTIFYYELLANIGNHNSFSEKIIGKIRNQQQFFQEKKPLANVSINNGYSTKTIGNYGNQQQFL